MNDTLLCFPVTHTERKRLEKICQIRGINKAEFFRRALIEAELDIVINQYTDPDTAASSDDDEGVNED